MRLQAGFNLCTALTVESRTLVFMSTSRKRSMRSVGGRSSRMRIVSRSRCLADSTMLDCDAKQIVRGVSAAAAAGERKEGGSARVAGVGKSFMSPPCADIYE